MKKLIEEAEQIGAQIDVFKTTSTTTNIEVRNGKVESVDSLKDSGIAIRAIKDDKLGFAYSTDFDESLLPDLLHAAIQNSMNSGTDPFLAIPAQQKYESLKTFDREISELKIEDKIKFALEIEAAAYADNPKIKRTEKAAFSDSETKTELLNSNGAVISYHSNHCGGFCDVIAEDGYLQESGYGLSYSANLKDFKSSDIGIEAARRAIELLGAKNIPSQKLSLILDPYVGAQLLHALSNLFSSDAAQKGKSLFANKLGDAVASRYLTIIDDGRLINGLMSSPIDDEGVPAQKTALIENGNLSNFLYNTYTGSKDKKPSTGNGKRASYKSLPEVNPSNIYIVPGKIDPQTIFSNINRGLYVTRVMGMHTVNPVSGEFSIGAAGVMIERGEKTFPVRGITIAGNLLDLLRSIENVGNDLHFYPFSANVGSPTLLVSNIAVSG